MVMGKIAAVHGAQWVAIKKPERLENSAQAYHMQRQQGQCWYATGVSEYLDTREDHKQLQSKVRQLKHYTAAFSTPLLLPAVEPVGNQAPTEAD